MNMVIVAGGRDFTDQAMARNALNIFWTGHPQLTIISGGARGADRMGEVWAQANRVPLITMPADWRTYGRRAGRIRNHEMAKIATHLIAFWDGKSPGTKHMIEVARVAGIPIEVHGYKV